MDLKDIENKNELLRNIDILMQEYTNMLKNYANIPETYKRAALLYYWLKDYKNLLSNEKDFNSQYCPELFRGSIVSVNLGYNLGAELGGLHYGIVLSNSKRSNPNAIIVPLTSLKPNKDISRLRPTELYLGSEIYHQIQGKYTGLKLSIQSEIELLRSMLLSANDNNFDARIKELENKLLLAQKAYKKLQILKFGSIASMNQITTISKMRIVDPVSRYDILFGLKVSAHALDLISERISDLYVKNH